MLLVVNDAILAGGDHPIVVLPTPGPLPELLRERGMEVHIAPIGKLSRSSLTVSGLKHFVREMFAACDAFDRIVGSRPIDMVHSNTLAALGGAFWARRRGVANCWHVHEIVQRPLLAQSFFVRAIDWAADRVICNSQATADWLRDASRSRLEPRIRVIRNAVRPPGPPDAGEVARYRRVFTLGDENSIAIGLVGRINGQKGHQLLMRAAEALRARGLCNFTLVFVGDPPPNRESLLTTLEQEIALSNVGDRTLRLPFVADPWPVYAALDIVCVPTMHTESFGLVALEAMLQGRAVVASKVQGLAELIEDGISGLLFEPTDVDDLTAQLEVLLRNTEQRILLGNRARERARRDFDVARLEQQLRDVYREVRPDW
jgi:glycosyltransferase involved in cell wall biosynthesis